MVDRRHSIRYFAVCVNRNGPGGRVPPEREGMGQELYSGLRVPWRVCRACSLDVPCCSRISLIYIGGMQ
jgi:hypothetical protein